MGLLISSTSTLQGQTVPLGGLPGLSIPSTLNNSDSTQRDTTEKRSVKPRNFPKQISAYRHWFHVDTLRSIDSQLLLNHRYTPYQNSPQPILDLGTPGSPQILASHNRYKGGFALGLPLADAFLINPSNFKFHEVGQPYTRFQYSQGAGSYTGLEALHTQNFSPTWNITVNYRSVLNEDMFTGATQDNLTRNIGLGSNYISQNARYEQQIILSWNRNRRLENGGFQHDTLFYGTTQNQSETPIIRSFGIYVPTLNNAESFLSNTYHQVKQRYFYNSKKQQYIWHAAHYQNDRFTYSDKSRDSGYYGNTYNYSKTIVDDSTSLKYGTQNLGWGLRDTQSLGIFALEIAYRFQHAHLRSQISDTLRQSLWKTSHGYHVNAHWKRPKQLLQLEYHQQLSGYLNGNHFLRAVAQHRWNDSLYIEVQLLNEKQSPNLFQNYFLSNHFDFRGKLTPDHKISQTELSSRISYHSQKIDFDAGLQLGNMQGDIRSISTATPQILSDYQYIQSTLSLRYNTSDHWMLIASTHLQRNNAKEWDNLGFPALFARLGLSYQNNAFAKALIYRLGFDASYASSYQASIYRADNRQFFANSDNIALGNYPVLDVYFSGRIQTVDFFLKYEHLNHWWVLPFANSRYENTLNYPIQPDRFRFGFIWHFWN